MNKKKKEKPLTPFKKGMGMNISGLNSKIYALKNILTWDIPTDRRFLNYLHGYRHI